MQFPLRGTTVLTGSEALPIQIDLPVPDPVTGSTIALAGVHSGLRDGQTVVLQGNLWDPRAHAPTQTAAAEPLVLNGAPQLDPLDNVTFVSFRQPLANQYVRATCALLANIAQITQGETVNDEVLGSGDGSAFQSYALKKKPLTYLPSTDPQGLTAVASQLTVDRQRRRLDGAAGSGQERAARPGLHRHSGRLRANHDSVRRWNQRRAPAHRRQQYSCALSQGTGLRGQSADRRRPATRRQHARSAEGDQSDFLRAAETIPRARRYPRQRSGSLQTFDRAVSAPDYAALALSFPGIAKASATWVVQDPATQQAVAHPYVQLTAAPVDRTSLQGTQLGVQAAAVSGWPPRSRTCRCGFRISRRSISRCRWKSPSIPATRTRRR